MNSKPSLSDRVEGFCKFLLLRKKCGDQRTRNELYEEYKQIQKEKASKAATNEASNLTQKVK